MTHPNKARGNTLERYIVGKLLELGFQAQRAWGSDGRAMGLVQGVDILAHSKTGESWRIQSKKKKQLPKWLEIPEGVDCVVFNTDRGPLFVLKRFYDEFLDQRWEESPCPRCGRRSTSSANNVSMTPAGE
jgi:hypothetical protein